MNGYRIFLLTVGLVLISSCQESPKIQHSEWVIQKVNLRSFSEAPKSKDIEKFIPEAKNYYFKNSLNLSEGYDLVYSKSLIDEETGDLYHVFYLNGVDDLDLVFKQTKHSKQVSHFLYSPF